MKICFFSDIHGNFDAFSSGYKLILKEDADINIFLGDICGYYFDALKVWKELENCKNIIRLLGNHDKILLDSYAKGFIQRDYSTKYGPALEILLHNSTREFINWLKSAQEFYINHEISLFCCHGGPDNFLDQYLYPNSILPKTCTKLTIMGHTHYSMYRLKNNHYYGNPGSMGQPRDGKLPSFAVLHTEQPSSWEVKHFDYNRKSLTDTLQKMHNIPEYLYNVIWR
ncbi:metallophosphoesterase family protein [Desulfovibrio sp. ZJ369]|uniref:metallophosphoesterase family protein n=1 Tax=Desulfovibrio sp. ZJ369 TaxID=2709793 RepID=UPI0013ED2C7F|nr:metallophosphoesterase family protein [Desulfovibrio sp. ZJ369]